MKINDHRPITPAEVTRTSAPGVRSGTGDQPTGAGAVERPAAKVELSNRSRELHEALQAANEAPDVRREKVERVRRAVSEGRYEIDPQQIARRMLDRKA